MLQFIPLVRRCHLPHTIVVAVFHQSSSAEFVWFWEHTISFLLWPVIAILCVAVELLTENSWLEKSIDTSSRRIYDLLYLIEYNSVDNNTYRNEFGRSGAF